MLLGFSDDRTEDIHQFSCFANQRVSLCVNRTTFDHVAHRLRLLDRAAAERVDRIVANSAFVAGRVRRYWNRAAEVIHPPADLARFGPPRRRAGADAPYLFVSELTSYKRADAAVEAFRGLDRRLLVIGDGPDRPGILARKQ